MALNSGTKYSFKSGFNIKEKFCAYLWYASPYHKAKSFPYILYLILLSNSNFHLTFLEKI
jgi:hypothetical protein